METKILLIDDEVRILNTFARTLKLAGYDVITAADGQKGLTLYHREQPDIVLLDLRMPGKSGLEVLQAIREDDPEANVILCTAHGDKDAVIEALRAGASDFLPKPIDQVTLESALRRAEERIHLKRELRASQEALRRHNEQLEETVKARTAELEKSKSLLDATGRMARVGGWELDADALEVRWTEETYRIHEVPLGQQPSLEKAIDFFHPADRERLSQAIERALDEGAPYDLELRFITAKGNHLWTRTKCDPQVEDGKTVKLMGTFQDITDRKQAEAALRESLTKYRVLFDVFPLGITISDRGGRILEANPISERLLGISLEEHTTRDIDGEEWHIIRPDGSPMPAEEYASVRALQENQLVRNVEMGIVKSDDDVTWINVTAAPLRDDHVVITYNDITDRKQAEKALQQAQTEQIEDLRWLSNTALHLLSLGDGTEILDYAARALQEKLGNCFVWPLIRTSDGQALRLGNLRGMDDSLLGKAIQLIGFDPRKRTFTIIPEFREIYQQGQLFRHEGGLAEFAASEVPRPVGKALAKLLGVHDVYTIGLVGRERVLGNLHIAARRPELIEAPELVESFAHQVALALEQATASEALEESEERYRAVSELVSDYAYAFRVGPDGRLIGEWVTEAFYRITGYIPEELPVGESWNRLFHPEDRPAIERHIGKLLEGRPHDLAYRIITKDGDERWVHTYDRPVWDEREHRVMRIYGAVQDVTGRKRAEEALQDSYEQLSLLFDILPVGVSVLDQDRRIVEQNRALRRIVALSEEELLEGKYRNRLYLRADGSPMPAEEFPSSRILSGESEVQRAEVGVVKEDGELIWTDVRTVGCSIGDWRVVIVTTDVTERRQAQQALERVRYSIDQVTDSVLWVDEDGRFIDVNDAACRNLGYEREELLEIGVADVDPHYPAEVWDAHWAKMVECGTMILESVHETKTGERFPVEVVIHNQRFGDTRYNCVLARDITERKQAETALRESLTDLKLAQDIAAIGNWQFDPAVGVPVWSEEVYRIYARDPQLGPPHIDEYRRMYEPDQFAIFNTAIQRAIKEGQPYDITLKLKLPDDVVKWIHAICRPDEQKGPAGHFLRGTIQDITERKQVEERLRQYAERLRIQHEIDAAILAAQSPEEIARAALMRLRDLIPYQRASIAEIDLPNQKARTIVVLDEEREEKPDDAWHPLSVVERTMDALRAGRVYLLPDMAALEDPSPLDRTLVAAGARAAISVPLMIRDTVIGSLNLASETPGFFQPDHVEILEEIADSLAVALQQAHLLEQAQEDAEQKALLLREVNHRVLNNLTAIVGILDMEQRRSLDDEADFRAALMDVISRIDGMVAVHRMLSSTQWQPLDMNQVIEKVIHAALSSSPIQRHIEVMVDGPDDPVLVTPKQAITMALVINELTTNSIKYAFRDRARGRIEVDINSLEEDTRVELTFRDDGPGMNIEQVAEEWRNVGINLVETNVRHVLGGEVDFHNDGGAVASITFERAPLESQVD